MIFVMTYATWKEEGAERRERKISLYAFEFAAHVNFPTAE
jgi:hypothetical protein